MKLIASRIRGHVRSGAYRLLALGFATFWLGQPLVCSAQSAPVPLSIAEAQQLAVERSRQLEGRDQAIAASSEMAAAARALPDPVFKAGLDNFPVTTSERFSIGQDSMTMRRIGIEQDIPRAEKRELKAERSERLADKERADRDVTLAGIERSTALAWLDRFYAEAAAAALREERDAAESEVDAARFAYRSGHSSLTDYLAARSARLMLDDRVADAERRVVTASIALERWTGPSQSRALATPPSMASVRLQQDALEEDLGHHPEIAQLTQIERVADMDARLAIAEKKPDWTVEVSYAQRGPAYSNMISVGISVPLQWDQSNRQDRVVAAKLARAEEAAAERDEMLREHVAATRAMLTEWQSDMARRERYRTELIPLAKDQVRASLVGYRDGKSQLSEVLASRRSEIEVRLQALGLEADIARLWAQLNYLHPTEGEAAHGPGHAAPNGSTP